MTTQPKKYGLWVIVALVALRATIGFHFYSEGRAKLRDPKPFTAMFLGGAKGPLAPMYQSMIWDRDGLYRLNYAVDSKTGGPAINTEPTELAWDDFRAQAIAYYGFSDSQVTEANRTTEKWKKMLRDFSQDYRPDLLEYFHGVTRRDRNAANPAMTGVESLWGQRLKWESELKTKGAPLIKTADAFWASYEFAMYAIATDEQKSRGVLKITKPGRAAMDSIALDRWVPYFDLTIGLLLIFGLFTRVAAIAGGLFLASVVASQFPGATGALPTWYQAIEMLALFALAATSAGRFAGLDAAVMPLLGLIWGPKKTGNEA